ncbi:MAG: SGNH hydrolase domain-containing protein [Nitrosomonas sp.]
MNAIAESELSKHLVITTFQINSECGNLYLHTEYFIQHIDEKKLARCKVLGWYDNDKLRRLINESDSIWLASFWSEWVANFLSESLRNTEETFGKPVLVFGSNNFGEINTKELLSLTPEKRLSHVVKMRDEHIKIQGIMKRTLPANKFVDISDMLCESETHCKAFTDRGGLISYDGGHLTKNGATYLGQFLSKHSSMELFLK